MDPERRATVAAIAAGLGVPAESGRRLAELTSLGVGGPIEALLRPRDVASCSALLRELRGAGMAPRILGGGANVAASSAPVRDPVILTRTMRVEPRFDRLRFTAGAGMNIKRAVVACVRRGLGGLEWAEGIPGTMGGAVATNAGAYGGQTSDCLVSVTWLAPDGTPRRRSVAPEDFGYRRSPFAASGLVIEAEFLLQEEDPRLLESRMRELQRRRLRSQPPKERSAGCIFKNPPGDSAGRLIDAAGLKGLSVGGAVVSDAHANFIVNQGEATGEDVFALIDKVKERVHAAFGVALEEEVVRWS